MIEIKKLPVRRGKVPLRFSQGHFATNHSHINYYIDITYQKTRLSEAKDSAYQLVASAINDAPIDTILAWMVLRFWAPALRKNWTRPVTVP